jgi:ribosomal protein S18 acetylase RimI-like enzyme
MTSPLPHNREEVLIRYARPEDAARLRILRLEALLDTPEAFGGDFQQNQARSTEWWATKIRLGLEQGSETMALAEAYDRLVGMTGIMRGNNSKSQHSGTIYSVFVQPEWRSLGIGSGLVQACLEWGKEHGLRITRLAVAADNLAAIRCYEQCGFKTYALEKKAIHWEGRDIDELFMDNI